MIRTLRAVSELPLPRSRVFRFFADRERALRHALLGEPAP